MHIRSLRRNEPLPYALLLLADETLEAIQKYIFESELFIAESNGVIVGVYAVQTLNS